MTTLNTFRELRTTGDSPALFIANAEDSLSWYRRVDSVALYQFGKRMTDVLGAGLALILLAPVMLMTALMIKLESKGPIFFSQTRCGKEGKHFRLWKFRSMVPESEALKSQLLKKEDIRFKMAKDPRVTAVGSFIRKYSIDELPQLWNVLTGDMSLVGPRPPIPQEVERYSIYHHRRLAVTPGITCTWQIGGRSDIPFDDQVDMDIAYIRTRSLMTDLIILIKTPIAVITARGAY